MGCEVSPPTTSLNSLNNFHYLLVKSIFWFICWFLLYAFCWLKNWCFSHFQQCKWQTEKPIFILMDKYKPFVCTLSSITKSSCFRFHTENALEIVGGYKSILVVQFLAFLWANFSTSMVVMFSLFTYHPAQYSHCFLCCNCRLGDVLSSLTANKDVVPYENSMLTKVLADSLGIQCSLCAWVNYVTPSQS